MLSFLWHSIVYQKTQITLMGVFAKKVRACYGFYTFDFMRFQVLPTWS